MNCEYQKHFVFVIVNYPINRISIFSDFLDRSVNNKFIYFYNTAERKL